MTALRPQAHHRQLPARAALAQARRAPVADLAALTGGRPVLVLAPHPDDESLGCGGLIAACSAAAIPVEVALLTDGAASHPGSATHPPAALARLRAAEMRAALATLGLGPDALHELGWPDARAPRAGPDFWRAAADIASLIASCNAATILAPWRHDPHCDHEAAAAIAAAAAHRSGIRCLSYPVWGWLLDGATMVTAARAHRFDVTATLAAKRRAIACHRSQAGAVIGDADHGFVLPPALLDACLTAFEVYFEDPP